MLLRIPDGLAVGHRAGKQNTVQKPQGYKLWGAYWAAERSKAQGNPRLEVPR